MPRPRLKAALVAAGLAASPLLGASTAAAQCDCYSAYSRCDDDWSDRCERRLDWTYRDEGYRSAEYGEGWRYRRYGGYRTYRSYGYRRTVTHCDPYANRCARFRCDWHGDSCWRVSTIWPKW